MILQWQMIKRGSSRSCQYSTKNLVARLKDCGCTVQIVGYILYATYEVEYGDSAIEARDEITRNIRGVVGPKAAIVFLNDMIGKKPKFL